VAGVDGDLNTGAPGAGAGRDGAQQLDLNVMVAEGADGERVEGLGSRGTEEGRGGWS